MNSSEEREKSMATANESSIYMLMLVGILIGVVGVFLRFAGDSTMLSIISWAILAVGTVIACKGVFKILDAK
ncbi:MAG: hypothetical protein EOO99_04155 [Pedobacter sp.]|nr:MAG: hypothetical protein EOO99_04155 [Pedobacter sp.]